MANDVFWIDDNLYEKEKLAICFSKLEGQKDFNMDNKNYILNVYD